MLAAAYGGPTVMAVNGNSRDNTVSNYKARSSIASVLVSKAQQNIMLNEVSERTATLSVLTSVGSTYKDKSSDNEEGCFDRGTRATDKSGAAADSHTADGITLEGLEQAGAPPPIPLVATAPPLAGEFKISSSTDCCAGVSNTTATMDESAVPFTETPHQQNGDNCTPSGEANIEIHAHMSALQTSVLDDEASLEQRRQQQQPQRQQISASADGEASSANVPYLTAPLHETGEGESEVAAAVLEKREERTGPPPRVTLRRQGALSDLWQHQGAFRSNRRRMKSVFQEFAESLELPENLGKSKAQIKDIFTFTSVGYKHIVNQAPSEDRIAIHQAVVPTIDEETKAELDIDSIDTTPFAMFGVFDGHGGSACAEFLKNSVSTVLAHSPVLYDEDLAPFERRARATADSFTQLEEVHNEWARTSGDLSGSTAILSTFQDGILVMAGVGDSAGLYVDHEGKRHLLCPQHSTSNAREVERILNMGGTIVNNRVAGCLMPTRTIGDLDCKQALGDIVSPHPELKLAAIYAPPEDGVNHDEPFLVLASDGLWDVLSNTEVAQLTQRGLRAIRVKQYKADAKQEKARKGGGGGGGNQRIFGNKKSNKSEVASASSAGENSGGRSRMMNRFFEGGGKSGKKGQGGMFLDLSRSTKGLDASVRGGQGAGGHVESAALDQSLYEGHQASMESGMLELADGDEDVIPEGGEGLKPVAVTTTAATAGIRTSGAPADNPAMQLVHAAIRNNSKDDISVVVVSFQRGNDQTRPGSLGKMRRGSNRLGASKNSLARSSSPSSSLPPHDHQE